jgi:dihydrofolate reductase
VKLSFVLAVSENYGIGINNKLPWAHLKSDMVWFKQTTKGKPVVMGSSTWDSLPLKPLPGRTNVVLTTRGAIVGTDMLLAGEPANVVAQLTQRFPDQEVCVIGGAKVYEALWPFVDRIYLTRVPQVVEADTYLRIDDLMQSDASSHNRSWVVTASELHFDPDHVTFEIWDHN